MPTEVIKPEIWHVADHFGQQTWHYATGAETAVNAHKFHFWGPEGPTKQLKSEPHVTVAPTVFGESTVCTQPGCCSYAGVPKPQADRWNRERIAVMKEVGQ